MEIIHQWQDGPELLFAKCDGSLAFQELKTLEPILNEPEKTGTATDQDGNAKKNNRGIFFNEIFSPVYAECSPTSKLLEQFIKEAQKKEFTPSSVFQGLYTIKGFDLLFSAYRDGDYYKAHRDTAKLTVLLWIGEKDFDGGDLILPDFDYMIPYRPNQLVMFPSHYRHEVTKISTKSNGFVRYCATGFIH